MNYKTFELFLNKINTEKSKDTFLNLVEDSNKLSFLEKRDLIKRVHQIKF